MIKWTRDALLIGDLSLHYYGMLIALGVLLGVFLAMKRESRLGLAKDTTIDLALVGVPAALVGARLYYVAFSWDFYKDDLWKILSVREGGMAIYGGVLAALLAGWIFSRVRKVPFASLADLAAPSLALGQAVGRWGNFVNQEAYGYAVTDPALCRFPIAVFIEADGRWHLATFFYESAWCFLIVAFILLMERKGRLRRPGDAFLWYLFLYGAERAVVEGLRTDSLMLGPVRVSQLLAALLALGSLTALILRARRKKG
ncbi:MAG TPA: prolipoprotein diacylglyceryl transferase [Candidatus Pullichristensenella stercoripullorum]|nr:prolipoprotein diacylglyceryl transferase [Candidatus Pullichristensenella stercoripullorum]